jgi:putative glutamine amidotransferase
MATPLPSVTIGILGSDRAAPRVGRGWGIWSPGYDAAITAAGGTAIQLAPRPLRSWQETLQGVNGVVFAGAERDGAHAVAEEEALLTYCRQRRLPLLAIDQGMLALNTAYGGGNYLDLARELPEALQHRHPPEQGVRHAMTVERGTRLANLYGEGEIVVNSEHRRAVHRVARGFRVCARALDGVIEAIEAEDDWFALAVQWQPASATASGLDIQLFRGLVDACMRLAVRTRPARTAPPRTPVRQRRRLATAGV